MVKREFQPVPKPIDKKKKRKQNGYKDKPDRYCYYCGTPFAERHEVFGGPNRQISIDHGFQIDLCRECHREITEHEPRGEERDAFWKRHFQEKYEEKLIGVGVTPEQARNFWLTLIGRNYLEDEGKEEQR